jgi:hypothetical protein
MGFRFPALVSPYRSVYCFPVPAMKTIRRAACLPKAAEAARPLWGSFMAAAFVSQSGSSRVKSPKTQKNAYIHSMNEGKTLSLHSLHDTKHGVRYFGKPIAQ